MLPGTTVARGEHRMSEEAGRPCARRFPPMRVVVIGAGHVGLPSAAALAHVGHEVVGLDDDAGRVAALADRRLPFFEAGLQEPLDAGSAPGRLRFSPDASQAPPRPDRAVIRVGTPRPPTRGPPLLAGARAAGTGGRGA